MRRLWSSQRGSASVFLMLLVAPLFVFHAVLIDFVRIRMAEREAESALKVALRSTLSAYDQNLKAYGLYALGIDQQTAENLFKDVLSRNLNATEDTSSVFKLIEPVPDSDATELTGLYTLGNQSVFKQQVLEEMKFRAPAEFTVNVLDKLFGGNNAASALTGASLFEKRADEIEQWVVRREDALQAAWDLLLRLHEKAANNHNYFVVRLSELDAMSAQIGVHDAAEIQGSLSSLRNQSEQIGRSLSTQMTTLQELAKEAKLNMERINEIQASIGLLQNSLSNVTSQMDQWQTMLQVIAQFTLLLESSKGEVARDVGNLLGLLQDIHARIDEAQQADAQIRLIASAADTSSYMSPELIERTVLPESTYALYKVEASSVPALFSGFATALQTTAPFAGENRWTPERYGLLAASNEAYSDRTAIAKSKLQAEQEKRKQMFEATGRQKKEQLNRMGEILDQAKKLLADCGGVTGGSSLYDKLERTNPESGSEGLTRKYAQFNRLSEYGTESAPDSIPADATKARQGAFGFIDRLMPALSTAALSFRDELYVNEFALEKFNYRTYGKEVTENGQPVKSTALTNPAQHPLQHQEAEYALYGLSSCMLNQSAAYGEMFAFRLAVRTTEALLSPGSKLASAGSPLLLLLWAAAEGAVRAYKDMTDLVSGKPVPVSDKLAGGAITMQYKDYLRLFYLLHSNNKMTMARMQALIELDTGLDLTKRNTYVQGTARMSERLWFFPFIEPFIGHEVKRNRVYMQHTAFLSY